MTKLVVRKLVVSVGAASLVLAGCSGATIKHEGKVRTVSNAEEMIEDKLEKENPGKDYEVGITEEDESKKEKKRKKR